MSKPQVFLAVVAVVFLAAGSGCAHHLSGPDEPVKPPSTDRERPATKPNPNTGIAGLKVDNECITNFNSGKKHTRQRKASDKLFEKGDGLRVTAHKQKGEEQVEAYIDALTTLRNAVKKDHFSAKATYRLAAVYARLAKKRCAILLLKRLASLLRHPDPRAVRAATLAINNALDDGAFKKFRNEANSALGH